MFSYFDMAIGWGGLLKRTYKDTVADDALGLAAQMAYIFSSRSFRQSSASSPSQVFPLQNFTDDMIASVGDYAGRDAGAD